MHIITMHVCVVAENTKNDYDFEEPFICMIQYFSTTFTLKRLYIYNMLLLILLNEFQSYSRKRVSYKTENNSLSVS